MSMASNPAVMWSYWHCGAALHHTLILAHPNATCHLLQSTQDAAAVAFGGASTSSPKLSSKAKSRAAAQLFSPQPDPGSIERRLSFTDCNVRGATPPHKQLPLFKPAGESTPKASLPAPATGVCLFDQGPCDCADA